MELKYKDKLSGKEFTFTPVPNLVMVKFSPGTNQLMESKNLERDRIMTPLYDTAPSRSYGCFRLLSNKISAEDLSQNPNIEGIFPVVVDNEGNERYILPGEITVQFKDTVSIEEQKKIIQNKNFTILREQYTSGYYTLSLPAGKDIFEAIEELNALDEVRFAEPSSIGYNDALYMPDDSDFNKQWSLHNTGQTGGTFGSSVNAPEAWNIELGKPEIVIAVIDTGVDFNHQDLKDNVLPHVPEEDWDFADPDLIPEPGTGLGGEHGTHCAGIIAAMDNSIGIIGLAPRCTILPIRVDLQNGAYANRADAINFVTSIASRYTHLIMSCSWRTRGDIAAIRDAIIKARDNNILVCFAAGNDDHDTDLSPRYPGSMPEVLSVAATDHKDIRASFSNYGSSVDVSAPGVDIYSTLPGNRYGLKSGTSMSCPLVAGLAGLIWSKDPSLTSQQVREIIENNCDNIDALNPTFEGKLGKGRINAYKALQAIPVECNFKVKGQFEFPQKNEGSKSVLTFYTQSATWSWPLPKNGSNSYLLFLAQQLSSEHIYFLNPSTGEVAYSISPERDDTTGSMTWDGSTIRVANLTVRSGFIDSIDPSTGVQVGSIPAPQGRGEGMAYDGKYIFYSTITHIHQLVPSTGEVVRSFPVPGGEQCRALESDGSNLLFSGDPFKNEIIVFEKNSLNIICRFEAPGSGMYRVDGLAYNRLDRVLYITNPSENIIYYGTLG